MLPSVLPTESDHVPVLADEVVAALDPRPGEAVVDATFGAGGHASLLAKRLQGDGKLTAIDRDPTVAPYFERFRRSTGVRARLLHGEFSATLEQLAANGAADRRDPARPRRLVDAARPPGTGLLVRGRRATRHAHGSERVVLGPRARQRDRRARARGHLQAFRRGALREADRTRDRSAAQGGAVRAHGRARGRDQGRDPGPGPVRRRAIRRSASSRPCGSRSTTSSAPSSGRCRPRCRCCVPAAGSA